MKYRKKPIIIEAVQWKDNVSEMTTFLSASDRKTYFKPEGIVIDTLEGEMLASLGDYIIKGVQGEYYPCKPDIFEATYEKVEASE
jgi:hypothetical protein